MVGEALEFGGGKPLKGELTIRRLAHLKTLNEHIVEVGRFQQESGSVSAPNNVENVFYTVPVGRVAYIQLVGIIITINSTLGLQSSFRIDNKNVFNNMSTSISGNKDGITHRDHFSPFLKLRAGQTVGIIQGHIGASTHDVQCIVRLYEIDATSDITLETPI